MQSTYPTAVAPQDLAAAMTYRDYRDLTSRLFAQHATTSGHNSEAMLHYTHLNIKRMERLDKTTVLLPDTISTLHTIRRRQIWLTLTEGWCGDAAQIIPVLAKMADQNPAAVSLRFLLRDQHLELMDKFLTNGGRSIPKVIILDADTLEVIGSWGPRPAVLQQALLAAKQIPDTNWDALKTDFQKWYTTDKTASIQREFLAALVG